MKMETSMKVARKYTRLADDQKLEIGALIEKNTISTNEISVMYNCSRSTVCNIAKQLGYDISKRKSSDFHSKEELHVEVIKEEKQPVVETKKSEDVEKLINEEPKKETTKIYKSFAEMAKDINREKKIIKDKDFYPVTLYNVVKCGLVAGRHDVPVDKFIFSEDVKIFNFHKLDKLVNDFINDNIPFTYGAADYSITLYATGLQSALASVIKTCNMRKVNLSIMHYNAYTNEYEKQIIFNKFPTNNSAYDNLFNGLFEKFGNAYFYKSNIEYYYNKNIIYAIKRMPEYGSSTGYFCASFEDAWDAYGKLVKEINDHTEKHESLFLMPIEINGNTYSFKPNISKAANYVVAKK